MAADRVPALLPSKTILEDVDPLALRSDAQSKPGNFRIPHRVALARRAEGIDGALRELGLRHVFLLGYHRATTRKHSPDYTRIQREMPTSVITVTSANAGNSRNGDITQHIGL